MASYDNVSTFSLDAGADLSAKQYFFVKVGTADNAAVVCGDGENALGVLINAPLSGEPAAIANSGVVKVSAGGSITRGANVASDAAGEAVTAASGDYVLGIALEAADDGDIIRVAFDKNGVEPA